MAINFLKYKTSFLLFFLYSFFVHANPPVDDKAKIVEFLKKSKLYYDTIKEFKLNTSYNLYLGYNSKNVAESYKGVLLKKGNEYYSKIGATEFVYLKKASIKIDNESKRMQYTSATSQDVAMVYDMVKYTSHFTSFELKSTSSQWICILKTGDIAFVPYSKIIIHINKKDFTVDKQELFLLNQVKTKEKGKTVYYYPKLVLTFQEIDLNYKSDTFFSLSNYIRLKDGKVYPAKKNSAYKIVD